MARKNQRLINYHTSGKTIMPNGSDVQYGEIVVRHNEEAPELLIKVGEESFGVFQASGAVKTAIDSAVSAAEGRLNGDISTLEQSLSGHVADFETFQKDVEKTYATKTELETTSGNITTAYTEMVGEAKADVYASATSFATKEVSTAKGELNLAIAGIESNVGVLSGAVGNITTNIGANYVSNEAIASALTQVSNDITDAKADVFESGTTYTDAQIVEAKKYVDSAITVANGVLGGLIEGVDSRVDELSGTVNDNKTFLVNNFVATSALTEALGQVGNDITDAKADVFESGTTYTDAQIALAKEYSDGKLSAATESLNQTVQGVKNDVDTLSGNVHTTITDVQTALTETINNKVAVAYRYKGSCTYAELTGKTAEFTGEVWNVTDASGNFPAGTNYAWNGSEWDALGGSIDLSPYAKKEDVNKEIESIKQTNTGLQSAIDNVSAATKNLVGDVSAATVATYATKTELETTSGNIISAYTKMVDDAKAEVYGSATTFATSAVTAATASLNQTIEGVGNKVDALSGVTETVKATADSAVQTASADSGVSVQKEGTELKFTFAELIIDCGEF